MHICSTMHVWILYIFCALTRVFSYIFVCGWCIKNKIYKENARNGKQN